MTVVIEPSLLVIDFESDEEMDQVTNWAVYQGGLCTLEGVLWEKNVDLTNQYKGDRRVEKKALIKDVNT